MRIKQFNTCKAHNEQHISTQYILGVTGNKAVLLREKKIIASILKTILSNSVKLNM